MADFPRFVTHKLVFDLKKEPDMEITADVLNNQGFSVLALPMVDYEYHNKHLELNILMSIPEIKTQTFFAQSSISPQ